MSEIEALGDKITALESEMASLKGQQVIEEKFFTNQDRIPIDWTNNTDQCFAPFKVLAA